MRLIMTGIGCMLALGACSNRMFSPSAAVDPSLGANVRLQGGKPTVSHHADLGASAKVGKVVDMRSDGRSLTVGSDVVAEAERSLNQLLVPDVEWMALNVSLLDQQRQSVTVSGHPERVDIDVQASAFDREAWVAKPKITARSYASVAEPGRIYLQGSADLGDDPMSLLAVSTAVPVPGTPARIQLRATPLAPVSVYCPAQVRFGNGLNYATVIADERGLAVFDMDIDKRLTLRAEESLTFASPVNSGRVQVQFKASATD